MCNAFNCSKEGTMKQYSQWSKTIRYYCFNHSCIGCSVQGCEEYAEKDCHLVKDGLSIFGYCREHYVGQ